MTEILSHGTNELFEQPADRAETESGAEGFHEQRMIPLAYPDMPSSLCVGFQSLFSPLLSSPLRQLLSLGGQILFWSREAA
jgi:hypothetical protein